MFKSDAIKMNYPPPMKYVTTIALGINKMNADLMILTFEIMPNQKPDGILFEYDLLDIELK